MNIINSNNNVVININDLLKTNKLLFKFNTTINKNIEYTEKDLDDIYIECIYNNKTTIFFIYNIIFYLNMFDVHYIKQIYNDINNDINNNINIYIDNKIELIMKFIVLENLFDFCLSDTTY